MSPFYSPETYRAKDSIGYLVRRAGNLMTDRVEDAFAAHEITFAQWLVLMKLRDGLGCTAADIARDMCHDSGALTRVIDQLCQRGLIERTRGQSDRRTLCLNLTADGLRMVNSLIRIFAPYCLQADSRRAARFTPSPMMVKSIRLFEPMLPETTVSVFKPIPIFTANFPSEIR